MLRLARVREAASKNGKQSFTTLLHQVTLELLESSFYGLKRQAASGVDGITWQEYSENLEDKIVDLHNRILVVRTDQSQLGKFIYRRWIQRSA